MSHKIMRQAALVEISGEVQVALWLCIVLYTPLTYN